MFIFFIKSPLLFTIIQYPKSNMMNIFNVLHTKYFLYRTYFDTKFNPSSSLLEGLNEPTTISSIPVRSQSATGVKFSEYDTNANLPPRPTSVTRNTVTSSILKSSSSQWPPTASYYDAYSRDNRYEQRPSSSAHVHDDVQRLVSLSLV